MRLIGLAVVLTVSLALSPLPAGGQQGGSPRGSPFSPVALEPPTRYSSRRSGGE